MATFSPMLALRKNKNGTRTLLIRVYHNSKQTHISLGEHITDKQWNQQKLEVRSAHPNYDKINKLISDTISKLKGVELDLKRENKTVTLDALILSTKNTSADFVEFALEMADHYTKTNRIGTGKRYRSVVATLQKFHRQNISFEDINNSFLNRYEQFLIKKQNCKVNTVWSHMTKIRAVMNAAVKQRVISIDKNPFNYYDLRTEPVQKQRLSPAEIVIMETAKLPDGWLNNARNYFLFAFYCGGMRISEVMKLKRSDMEGNRIAYTRGKKGNVRVLNLHRKAVEIVNCYTQASVQYLFPILPDIAENMPADKLYKVIGSKTSQINDALKQVAKLLEINKPISTHLSRHSFAEQARSKVKDVKVIQGLLGHSSLSMTEKYLNSGFENTEQEEALNIMFGA